MKPQSLAVLVAATFSLAAAASSALPQAEADELAFVATTLEYASLCKIAPAKYGELVKFSKLARDLHVKSNGVNPSEVDGAFSRGRAQAQAQARSLTPQRCEVIFKDVERANTAFLNINKTLTSLADFGNDLESALKSKR